MAENIARQLERRANFRRAVKMSAQNTMNAGAKGIRIEVAGRLNGAEMSRREKTIEGSVPLHTLRADVDFHAARAQGPNGTGIIGVKVWIFKGEIMEHDPQAHDRRAAEAQDGPAPRGPRRDAR